MSNVSSPLVNMTGHLFCDIAKSRAIWSHFAHNPGRVLCSFKAIVHLRFFQNCNFLISIERPSDRSGILSGIPQWERNKDRYFWGVSTTARGCRCPGCTAAVSSGTVTDAALHSSSGPSPTTTRRQISFANKNNSWIIHTQVCVLKTQIYFFQIKSFVWKHKFVLFETTTMSLEFMRCDTHDFISHATLCTTRRRPWPRSGGLPMCGYAFKM